jgi:hypothetical protein
VWQPQQTSARLALAQANQECATRASQYVADYKAADPATNRAPGDPFRTQWSDPEYHFNTKLNTCLVAMSSYQYGLGPSGVKLIETNSSFVVDLNSNKTILIDLYYVDASASTTPPTSENTLNYQKQKAQLFTE